MKYSVLILILTLFSCYSEKDPNHGTWESSVVPERKFQIKKNTLALTDYQVVNNYDSLEWHWEEHEILSKRIIHTNFTNYIYAIERYKNEIGLVIIQKDTLNRFRIGYGPLIMDTREKEKYNELLPSLIKVLKKGIFAEYYSLKEN